MTTPINVDEARVALKTWSLRIPKAQMALLNAALDRLEELEQAVMDWEIATSASCCKKNEATIERISAAMSCVPEDGDDLVEAVKFLVQERDGAKAHVKELEARPRGIGDRDISALFDERDAAQAQCAEAERAANKVELQCVENLQALGAATQNNGALRAQLETAKRLLKRYRKGLSQEHITLIDFDCDAFLSSKEGEE